ncbi:MAG TPA: transposase, partial [Candidatus Nanoarchaeia archaeon]|nr:transposase [Candidatus Nanoarchaeia archaeon]
EVPLDNNHAERELRPIVLLRKVIGCYRNEKGQKWIDNVLSVLHTWKLQGKNLYQQLRIIPT